jgi:transcriptional regulator with XRE-family HTH domain
VQWEFPREYPYAQQSGIPNLVLVGNGVAISRCRSCRETTTSITKEQELLQLIGLVLVTSPPGMTGEHLRFLRGLFNMTQGQVIEAMGKNRRETVAELEKKEGRLYRSPDRELALRLALLGLFKSRVIDSDHYFLTEKETGRFQEFCTNIALHVSEILAEKPQPRLVVRHDSGMASWRTLQPMAI